MIDRTVHLPVAAQSGVDAIVDLSRTAETLGYERVWMPETWGRDLVTTLTSVANDTDSIGLGPSVANVYSRSPALVAQTAATLQEVSDGRLRMGLGPSGPAVVEGWHGIEFDRPLRRTREYVDVVRTVLAGDRLEYDGEIFTLSGFRLRGDPPETPPAIDVAGMGPKFVELAGRFADGWHAIVQTPDGLRERLEDFQRGADLGGRDIDEGTVTLSLTACALEDGDRARRLCRQHLAFYLGAMGTFYRDSLARQGYEAEANEIAAHWANGDREAAVEAIDDELLDRVAACGTPDRAREAFRKFASIDGLDEIAVGFPRGADPEEQRATLEALAP